MAKMSKNSYQKGNIRRRLLKRHGNVCMPITPEWGCGQAMSQKHGHPREMTLDHIIPIAQGGSDHIHNLQLACRTCNHTKSAAMEEQDERELRPLDQR